MRKWESRVVAGPGGGSMRILQVGTNKAIRKEAEPRLGV